MMQQILTQAFWHNLFNKFMLWAETQLPSILLLILLWFISLKFISILIRRLRKILIKHATKSPKYNTLEASKRINTLLGILKGLGKIIIWSVFLMTLLKKLGIDVGPILAGAGILGLAIGFGAQELVRDFISGFFILLENQVRAGDYAIINGTTGLIESIELRTITMRDFSGVVHVFQNGKVDSLANMTKEWSAIILEIGVAYKEDVDYVIQVMKEVGENMFKDPKYKDIVLEDLKIYGLDKFADSAIVIKARLKTIPGEQWTMGREYRRRLKIVFDEKGIEIPFPHTTVYWGEKINPLDLNIKK